LEIDGETGNGISTDDCSVQVDSLPVNVESHLGEEGTGPAMDNDYITFQVSILLWLG
jgi:hypothetical protein